MALVETSAECSLIYDKPKQFPGPNAYIDGYSGQTIEVKPVSLLLEIRWLPMQMYTV